MSNSSDITLPSQEVFKPEFGPITHFILEYCPEFLINPEANIDENLFREKLNLNPNDFYQVIKDLKLLSTGIIDILFSMLDMCLQKIPHIFTKDFNEVSPDSFAAVGLKKMACKYIFQNMKHIIDSIPESLVKSKHLDCVANANNELEISGFNDTIKMPNNDNSNVYGLKLNTNITLPTNRIIEMNKKVADSIGDMASSKTKFFLHSFISAVQKNSDFFEFFQNHPYLFYIQPIEQLKEFGDQHNINRRAKVQTTIIDTVKIKFKVQ